ncbi:MAG: Ppx/GppA phosphatase family protein [Acidimicrobiales bacterium]
MSPAVAAIDCGTNSTRLLVADAHGNTLAREMHITRLGRGVDATRRLDPAAIADTLAVLARYRTIMDSHHVGGARLAATSAARDATNASDFLLAAEKATGIRPELLSGEEEARLSFAGAMAELAAGAGPYLVADIGGGSTELAVGPDAYDLGLPRGGDPIGVFSLDVGCLRISERYLHSDPPAPEELTNALWSVREDLELAAQSIPALRQAKELVGLAGTVSTVAAVDQGLTTYDRHRIHHHRLSRAAVEEVFRTLATETHAERRHNPGLEADRVAVIVGGVVVLVALMRHFGFDSCLVSEADILDGLAATCQVQ